MDSPVQIPFKSFVRINSSDKTAVYLQIVFEFIKAIQLGLLPEGTKLPGTRALCKVLSVNRNTLIKSFQELESQGFVEIKPNKGVFILSDQKENSKNIVSSSITKNGVEKSSGINFKRSSLLENPTETSDLNLQFNDGLPDGRLAQSDVLARLYVSELKGKNHNNVPAKQIAGTNYEFKKQISNFLNLTRNLKIAASNLLTTTSHEVSLYLLFKMLIAPGDKVVVGMPGYYLTNMTIADSGADIITVQVDDDGIDTSHLRRICQEQAIRILYLTSVYHYPTTVSLTAKRRIEILELATEYGFIIIEDDYEFDLHFDNNPILPLAAMDSEKQVIYVGSLGRSLPVGFGYGFVSAPEALIQELEKHKNILEPGIDLVKEQVLTAWINEGEIHRLLKKNKKIYKERRTHFEQLLNDKFKAEIKFKIPVRGLAFWVEWIKAPNLFKLKKKCEELGLFLPKTILYQTKDITATRLGFGGLEKQEMEDSLTILKQSLEFLNA
ncbi:PLP-dependent aminotransferase family protein [Pedobacter aquatilis]|uniref:aminotransferase-like domain-containing protein n=1 Tax=Pedobacter aquatilis TaxID=351343 RepID=UPI00292F1759|nr:PLP-dependent aminotransferase family protein [Pedobacter aquatilis]